ncbi:PrpF domain-containing protein [Streptomyces sp. Da 82-17]|uniref:PrpF domain-containing protein n=1 Tax=Streptomyces sp. Da 82-17 TaxID=3377116 RepID=UPI0038D46D65
MIGHLVQATGAPCPTLVLDARRLPEDEPRLLRRLAEVRRELLAAGAGHVLKIALARPSTHPLFDLDYYFVQVLPGPPDRFELRGSCGHSILATAAAAERAGMIGRLAPGSRVRVRVLNTEDSVVCELEQTEHDEARFTATFVQLSAVPFDELLLTGRPVSRLVVDGAATEVSLVNSGNPYAFVDARDLGVATPDALFAAGDALFARLERIRAAAADRVGSPRTSVFPKIAALVPGADGALAVRALSVPGWHPTLALTGAVCLAAAAGIPHTVPWRLARQHGTAAATPAERPLVLVTPGSRTVVTAASRDTGRGRALSWTAVAHKEVAFQGSLVLDRHDHRHAVRTIVEPEEADACLSLSAAA